jgi:hypothetical protein
MRRGPRAVLGVGALLAIGVVLGLLLLISGTNY